MAQGRKSCADVKKRDGIFAFVNVIGGNFVHFDAFVELELLLAAESWPRLSGAHEVLDVPLFNIQDQVFHQRRTPDFLPPLASPRGRSKAPS